MVASEPAGGHPSVVHGMSQVQAARWYLEQGLRPIPWEIGENNRKRVGIAHFTYQAYVTAPRDVIENILRLWEDQPDWQVGLALHQDAAKPCFVLDVDSSDELTEWESTSGQGEIHAQTWRATTGRSGGGYHYLYLGSRRFRESFGGVGAGSGSGEGGGGGWPRQGSFEARWRHLEIKSNGFVAVAPSIHPTGRPYLWDASCPAQISEPDWRLTSYLATRETHRDALVYGEGSGGLWSGSGGGSGENRGRLDINTLIQNGAGNADQDMTLSRMVFMLAARGRTDSEIRDTWLTVVTRTPLLRSEDPWTEDDFLRHLRGARRKLGSAERIQAERASAPGAPGTPEVEWAQRISGHYPEEVGDTSPVGVVPGETSDDSTDSAGSAGSSELDDPGDEDQDDVSDHDFTPMPGGGGNGAGSGGGRDGDDGDGDGSHEEHGEWEWPARSVPLTYDELIDHTCDHVGMAEMLVALMGGLIRWDEERARFWVYSRRDGRWYEDGRGHEQTCRLARRLGLDVHYLIEMVVRSIGDMPQEGENPQVRRDRIRAVRAWSGIFRGTSGIRSVVGAVTWSSRRCQDHDFDRHDHLLNTLDGTYDVSTGELRAPDPRDLLRHKVMSRLNPDLACKDLAEVAPHFAALLRRMCASGKEEERLGSEVIEVRRAAVMRWLGYQLHGSNPEKKLAVFEGATNIGKNQVLEIVGDVLGRELAWLSARPPLLVRSSRERPETEESKLRGKRLAVVNELTETQVLDEGQVLRLVNPRDSMIELRELYQNPATVPITWSLTITTNELPKGRITDAVAGRLLLLTLSNEPIPASERYDIKRVILDQEREAVFAHLVSWWRAWYQGWADPQVRSGLVIPAESLARIDEYQGDNSHPAQMFIDECLEFGEDFFVPSTVLWDACDHYYKRQHSDTDRRYLGGRRKLYDLVGAMPDVVRKEKKRGKNQGPLLQGFTGVRLAESVDRGASETRLSTLSERNARG